VGMCLIVVHFVLEFLVVCEAVGVVCLCEGAVRHLGRWLALFHYGDEDFVISELSYHLVYFPGLCYSHIPGTWSLPRCLQYSYLWSDSSGLLRCNAISRVFGSFREGPNTTYT
jgi:hypothetical protein